MDVDVLYRTIPFAALALVLLGWALIELLQTRLDDWDLTTTTIVAAGLVSALYLGSLAINFSPINPGWKEGYFEAIRVACYAVIPGIPRIYKNVWRAYRARRIGQFRRKVIYDVHDDRLTDAERSGLP